VTLASIAARAELFHERLASLPDELDDAPVARRIQRWRECTGNASFEERLARDRIDPATLPSLLGDRRDPDSFPLPAWAQLLREIIASADGRVLSPSTSAIPFEEILRPIVAFARQRVTHSSPDLERLLLLRLSRIAAPSLLERFRATKVAGATFLANLGIPGTSSDSAYRAFVSETRNDGLFTLFDTYPLLGRFVATLVEQWIDMTNELMSRFDADRDTIRETFGVSGDLERIDAVADDGEGSLSDPHERGRTVLILHFRGGGKVVYKPRPHAFEEAFVSLLATLNERGAPVPWHTLKLLARPDYAWIEYVGDRVCASENDVRTFYRGAGAQLFLAALLGATDCHFENVVAHGTHPVLIDMETLLLRDRGAARAALIHSGLLPRWQCSQSSAVHANISGLAAVGGQVVPKVRWHDVHRDAIGVGLVDETLDGGRNLPLLDGKCIPADAYIDEIVEGFTATYRFFMRDCETLREALQRLRGVPSRWIVRATSIYYAMLHSLMAPQHLRNGIDWSIELDRLSIAWLDSDEARAQWDVYGEELRALERLDIPYFITHSDSHSLFVNERVVARDLHPSTAFGDLMSRIDALSEEELTFQSELIAASFDSPSRSTRSTPLPNDFVAEAGRIGDEILARAIPTANGLTWLGLSLDHGNIRQLEFLGSSIYKGRRGIALFLAALAAETGDARYADAARAAVREPSHDSTSLGIDGDAASAVYALTRMSGLLGDPSLLDDAHRATVAITAEAIEADRAYDVMSGCAGALLALCALQRVAPSREIASRIDACARKLADAPLRLTGFSHGAAGIALALRRAAFDVDAQRVVAWETSHYLAEQHNWRDLRESNGEPMTSWCHGAPGIALSRIAASMDDEHLDAALDTTLACGTDSFDHVCCGNFGRIEVLLVASRTRPSLREVATSRAKALVERAAREGGYRTSSRAAGGSVLFDPVFFQGMSGIGYQLLRLARPDAYPSLLALE
jgi:type 2 lantibiotic biosynthesis protein LanM